MKMKIIAIGIITILIATGFTAISAATHVDTKNLDTTLEVKIFYSTGKNDEYVGKGAIVSLDKTKYWPEGGSATTSYFLSYSKNIEENNIKYTIYTRDFECLECKLLDKNCIYEVVVNKGVWTGKSERYNVTGIRNVIEDGEVNIGLSPRFKSKSVNSALAHPAILKQ